VATDSAIGTPEPEPVSRDPRHVFLDARAVMHRYGWGKTRGYEHLKDRTMVPAPVLVHPNRWRLDQLIAWEDRRIAASEPMLPDPAHRLADLLPPSKRSPRRPP
jgi:hypothetical protein